LQHVVFSSHIGGQEFSRFLGEVHQDRAGLENGDRLAAGTFVVDDGGDFRVRIDLDEIRVVLIALPHIDEMLLVGQFGLFQHDVDFLHVRAGQRIKIDHANVLVWRGRETIGRRCLRQGATDRAGASCALVRHRHCRVGSAA